MKAGRPLGTSAVGRSARRDEILGRISGHLLAEPSRLSLRELARVAGVTVPTLRHYFHDRSGLMRALFEHLGEVGRQHHHPGMMTTELPLHRSIREVTARFAEGFASPLLAIHRLGLLEGFAGLDLAHAYLGNILEPSLQAVEQRIALHVRRRELPRSTVPRFAALQLVSPLFVAALHQSALGGSEMRELSTADLARSVADNFLRNVKPGR